MSDTEIGTMPKPHVVVASHDGLIRWQPEYDSLRVDCLRDGGRRITVNSGGVGAVFDITPEQARGLSLLLTRD